MTAPRSAGPSTLAVHAGTPERSVGSPVSGAIYQSTTFVADALGRGEVLYSRYTNNPNHRRLEAKIAALEGAEACLVTGSGMGAMSAAVLACVQAGDHVLAANDLYGGTRLFLKRELCRLGIEATFVEFRQPDWRDHLRPNTRVVLIELPTNPLMRVPDPRPIVEAAHAAGAIVIADVTFATPINFRGLEYGIDLVFHSATKYLGGHSDVTAGAVCGRAELVDGARVRATMFGTALDPHATWLLERGIKTLALRVERQNANGLEVARWLSERPEVARVHYPGLPTHPDHEIARQILKGFGGMVGLELVGGAEAATRFLSALRLATVAPSLGGVETLVSEPRFTSHVSMTPEQRAAAGIPDGFVRMSLGIEDAADIIADLNQALERASAGGAAGGAPTAEPVPGSMRVG